MHIPIISAALNLLMGSVALVSEVYRENQKALYAALVINCVLWLFAGLKLKFQYLWISGALGCFLIVISIFV